MTEQALLHASRHSEVTNEVLADGGVGDMA